MNPDIKAKWVAALRSGQYKQGRNALAYRYPNGGIGFCCLGVLCEIAVAEGVIPPPMEVMGAVSYGEEEEKNHQLLPRSVGDWAGANHYEWGGGNFVVEVPEELDQVVVGSVGTRDALSALNDHGVTFAQIADLIEARL